VHRQGRLAWLGLLGRYLLLVVILGLIATPLYASVDADDRPTVVRLAVAAFVTVVLIHIHSHFRQQREEAPPSAFAQAQRAPRVDAKVATAVQRLKDEVKAGVSSQRYFNDSLWPRLVRLSEQHGTRERLSDPPEGRWRRRGPSLFAIGELVRRIGDDRRGDGR
jgi:hypothetical protein